MSCQLNVDPYNNFPASKKGGPPPRPGEVHGTFGTRIPQSSQMQHAPLPERNTTMAQRPARQVLPQNGGNISLEQENAMLYSDLRTAIDYINQLGGVWPPPGH